MTSQWHGLLDLQGCYEGQSGTAVLSLAAQKSAVAYLFFQHGKKWKLEAGFLDRKNIV